MADINEKITIETAGAVGNVDDLTGALTDADKWIDNVIAKAKAADGTTVDIPVDAPGADTTAAALDTVAGAADTVIAKAGPAADELAKLPGPLGDTAGKADDMTSATGSLNDLLGPFAANLGLSGVNVTELATGVGIAGAAVGIATKLWQDYKKRQDEAKKAVEDMIKVQQDFQDGHFEKAAQSLVDKYTDLYDAAGKAGAGADVVTQAMLGNKDALDGVQRALIDSSGARMFSNLPTDGEAAATKLGEVAAAADGAAGKILITNDRVAAAAGVMADLSGAAGPAATDVDAVAAAFQHLQDNLDIESSVLDVKDAFDGLIAKTHEAQTAAGTAGADTVTANRDAERSTIRLKDEVIRYAEQVGNIPTEKVTQILADIDEGSIGKAEAEFNLLTAPATKRVGIDLWYLHGPPALPAGVAAPTSGSASRQLSTTTVNNNFPPAITPLAVETAQQAWQRVNGPI